jgi:hypothetical protein
VKVTVTFGCLSGTDDVTIVLMTFERKRLKRREANTSSVSILIVDSWLSAKVRTAMLPPYRSLIPTPALGYPKFDSKLFMELPFLVTFPWRQTVGTRLRSTKSQLLERQTLRW